MLLPVNYLEPDFQKKLRSIKTEFLRSGYAVEFINDTLFGINDEEKEKLSILEWLFDEKNQ